MENKNQNISNTSDISTSAIEKIKNEELLRARIRNSFEQTEKKNKLIEFLNSSFGLFILSAILVTGVGNYLTRKFQERDSNILQKKEAVRHLIELDYRVFQIDLMLKGIDDFPADAWGRSYLLTRVIQADNEKEYTTAINDYKTMTMIELLSWFTYNYHIEKMNNSDEALEILKRINGLKSSSGIWDTKKMKSAMGIIKHFLDDMRRQLKN